jgi:hypothetical protein
MLRGIAVSTAPNRYDFAEYINFPGVFQCKDGASSARALDPRNPTLAIRNLTAWGSRSHPQNAKAKADIYFDDRRTADNG